MIIEISSVVDEIAQDKCVERQESTSETIPRNTGVSGKDGQGVHRGS